MTRINMKKDGSTKITGILGYPIEHTASPCMHNAAFKALKLGWEYIPFEVKPQQLKLAMKSIRTLGMQGVNVTIPHKKAVVPFLDELSDEAEFIGAVNTIVRKGNKLIGYNTDGEGFIKALEEENISYIGKNVLVLGAGGAANGIIYQLLLGGAKRITIVNRTIEKAEALGKHFKTKGNIEILPFDDSLKSAIKDADILINTTSVGMKDADVLLVDKNSLPKSLEAVVDIIYNPPETKLLRIAKKKGIKTMNGLSMLLHQGALSFELWTGKKAPIEVMRKALYQQFKM